MLVSSRVLPVVMYPSVLQTNLFWGMMFSKNLHCINFGKWRTNSALSFPLACHIFVLAPLPGLFKHEDPLKYGNATGPEDAQGALLRCNRPTPMRN